MENTVAVGGQAIPSAVRGKVISHFRDRGAVAAPTPPLQPTPFIPYFSFSTSRIHIAQKGTEKKMPEGPVTTIHCGFKIPVAVLDESTAFSRQTGSTGPAARYPPRYYRELDEASKLLCARIGGGDSKLKRASPYRT